MAAQWLEAQGTRERWATRSALVWRELAETFFSGEHRWRAGPQSVEHGAERVACIGERQRRAHGARGGA